MSNFEEFDKISKEIMRNSEKYKENFVNNFHSADCELRKPHGEKCTCGFVKKPTREEKLREALEKCVEWMNNNTEFDCDQKEFDSIIELSKKALEE